MYKSSRSTFRFTNRGAEYTNDLYNGGITSGLAFSRYLA